jgi:hypothetical protein
MHEIDEVTTLEFTQHEVKHLVAELKHLQFETKKQLPEYLGKFLEELTD